MLIATEFLDKIIYGASQKYNFIEIFEYELWIIEIYIYTSSQYNLQVTIANYIMNYDKKHLLDI